MARGWESKSVEDQMDAAESARAAAAKPKLTPEEVERQTARDGLLLSRARTLTRCKAPATRAIAPSSKPRWPTSTKS